MNLYWTLFKTFFRIGIFTIGGGYAMIPLIEADVVDKRHWVSKEEFMDLVAVAQSCPGIFAANLSIFIGYRLRLLRGAMAAVAGTVLPSFVCILAIALCFHDFKDYPVVEAMFRGIRPAVVALMAVPTFNMARTAHINWSNCWIPIAGALAICLTDWFSPVYLIVLAGLGGWIYGQFIKPTE